MLLDPHESCNPWFCVHESPHYSSEKLRFTKRRAHFQENIKKPRGGGWRSSTRPRRELEGKSAGQKKQVELESAQKSQITIVDLMTWRSGKKGKKDDRSWCRHIIPLSPKSPDRLLPLEPAGRNG
uniref:Uncharacterized protein n=1 Tax=Cannabis sativa TaxID=3483 RepID=A0A803P0Z0_CANSA